MVNSAVEHRTGMGNGKRGELNIGLKDAELFLTFTHVSGALHEALQESCVGLQPPVLAFLWGLSKNFSLDPSLHASGTAEFGSDVQRRRDVPPDPPHRLSPVVGNR